MIAPPRTAGRSRPASAPARPGAPAAAPQNWPSRGPRAATRPPRPAPASAAAPCAPRLRWLRSIRPDVACNRMRFNPRAATAPRPTFGDLNVESVSSDLNPYLDPYGLCLMRLMLVLGERG